jgi:hypothetical protein
MDTNHYFVRTAVSQPFPCIEFYWVGACQRGRACC